MFTRRAFLATGVSVVAERRKGRGQEQAKFSVDVKVVNVVATVRNGRHEIITELSQDDFLLEEDGRPQRIRYFSRESDLPLTLGLAVDTSGSQWQVLDAERDATRRFLDQVLHEGVDQAFVMRFDLDVDRIGGITSSRHMLEDALAQLDASDTPGWRERHPFVPPANRFWRTALYDAIAAAARDLPANPDTRKALIVLSDGVDNVSASQPDMAIEAVQRGDALVYSILFSDPAAYSGARDKLRARGIDFLRRLCHETGGTYFEITRANTLRKVFHQIEEELRSEYSLGYVSDRDGASPGYRKIRLSTRREGLLVRARDGYYVSA